MGELWSSDLTQAATKLQACQRRKMAAKKVSTMREEKKASYKAEEKSIQNKGEPCTDEETAASIKIQAILRRKQAQKKVAEIKQHQHLKAVEVEEEDAAKKIQSQFRKRSVDRE